jgi:hypothetical protein
MLTVFETDFTATDAERAVFREAFAYGNVNMAVVAAMLGGNDAREPVRAHVAVVPAPTSTPATVTPADRAKVRAIRARVNAADAKAALLDEISRKHGQAAAKAAQDLSIDALVKRAAAPSREAIAESWTRALQRAGATVQTAPTNGPKAAAQSNSWDRVWLSKGFELDPSAGRRPAALHTAGIVAPSPRGR